MTNLPAAIRAVQKGFWVFPVEPGEKTPHRQFPHRPKEQAPWTIRWSEAATNDVNRVVQWWTVSPHANIGIACKPSGLLVVDLDVAKEPMVLKDTIYAYLHQKFGEWVDGSDVFRVLLARYGESWDEVINTYRVCTRNLGLHLYYRWPKGVTASQASLVKGVVDIRCNGGEKGGYVLGDGSQVAPGAYTAENDLPIMDAPPFLVELVREKPPPPRLAQPRGGGLFSQPRNANFGGLVDSVRLAPKGNRNNVLLWSARSMCEDGAPLEEALRILVPAALEAQLDGGERQAEATIRSAYRLQERKG